MKRVRPLLWLVVLLLSGLVLLILTPLPIFSAPSARLDITRAWQNADRIGAYQYRTSIRQVTRPVPKLVNLGLSSQEDHVYIEGDINRPADTMHMTLWSQGGNVFNGRDGLEIKVVAGEAMGRLGQGEWESVDNVGDFFAPGGDPLGFLNAAANIELIGQETRTPGFLINNEEELRFTRYRFDVDGLAFAEYMRAEMEAELRRKGELPTGMRLDTVRTYIDMTGEGELWLDESGLPLRQVVRLQFPPLGDEQVEAEIQTDFHSWQGDVATASAWLPRLQHHLGLTADQGSTLDLVTAGAKQVAPWLLTLTLLVALLVLVIRTWRSPRLYNAMALSVMLSMLFVPLLQSQQVSAFYQTQQTRQTEADQTREQQRALREAERELYSPNFDPHRNPLAVVAERAAEPARIADPLDLTLNLGPATGPTGLAAIPANAVDSDGDGLPDDLEDAIGSNKNAIDTDGDTLEDGVEVELGTEPALADTDGDGIPDNIEVQGFFSFNKTWYLNPLSGDTNRDGRPDNLECPTGLECADTDGDGTPDAFDFDDDNDGVPDLIDTSATTALGTGQDKTYTFQIDSLNPGKTTFVDFQLRPTNPEQLWYAFNVLDWPGNDREGQVTRISDTTLGASGKDANGDMKVVPLLEIEIPFDAQVPFGNLPVKDGVRSRTAATPLDSWLDRDRIEDYGLLVRQKDNSGNLLVYAPVNIVRDTVGDSIVAFSARMPYWPTGNSFGKAHQARLVWTVQTLIDTCQIPDGETDNNYCDNPANWQTGTEPQIVHSYYEPWFLTGLGVQEDHGVKMAAIFENKDIRDVTGYAEYLWQMADGLDSTFVAGRLDANAQRDLTIDDIQARFDVDSNAAIAEDDARLWNIPKDALRVKTFEFDDQSGMATLPISQTQELLQTYYADGFSNSSTVSILFAREERYRSANLDMGGGVVFSGSKEKGVIQSNNITLRLDPNLVKPQLMVGLNWAPYLYKGAGVWEAYALNDYWDYLDGVLANIDIESGLQDELVEVGQREVAKNYFLSMYKGVNGVVEVGNVALELTPPASDVQISIDYSLEKKISTGFETATAVGKIVNDVATKASNAVKTKEIVNSFYSTKDLSFKDKFYAGLGGIAKGYKQDLAKTLVQPLREQGLVKGSMAVAGAVAGAALSLASTGLYIAGLAGAKGEVLDYIGKGIGLVNAVKSVVETVQKVAKTISELKSISDLASKVGQSATVGAAIGLILSIGVQVGVFLYTVLSGTLDVNSEAFVGALAQLLAMIGVAVFLFFLAQIPILGQILLAVLGLLEALIQLVCKIIGESGGICAGIVGNISKFLSKLFFNEEIFIDMQHENRLTVENVDMDLANPDKGFAVGSEVRISADVISRLYPADDDGELSERDDKQVRSATFAYQIQGGLWGGSNIDDRLDLNQLYWPKVDGVYTINFDVSGNTILPLAGINQNLPRVRLAEGYVVPVYRCVWMFPSVHCSFGSDQGTNHIDLVKNVKFDVFPSTLDRFYNLVAVSGGYAQIWTDSIWGTDAFYGLNILPDAQLANLPEGIACKLGRQVNPQSTCAELPFPTLADADGDGLRSEAAYGNDPDDSKADMDGDGLSDFYEIENGISAGLSDTDNDGLSDYEEVRLVTNPNWPDSDGDGLSDKEEVEGWLFEYAPGKFINVTTNPLDADSDGDGTSDFLERAYKTNPASALSGGSFAIAELNTDRYFVAPGQTFTYTAVVAQDLKNTVVAGNFAVEFPLASNLPAPENYTLAYQQVQTFSNQITVDPVVDNPNVDDSRVISLTATVGGVAARFGASANPPTPPAPPLVQLALEERRGATTFANNADPAFNGTCSGDACPQVALPGRIARAAQFDGSDDVITFADDSRLENFEDGFTLSLWLNPQNRRLSQEILSTRPADEVSTDGFRLTLYSTLLGIDFCRASNYGSVTVAENLWTHVLVSFTANERQPPGSANLIGDLDVYQNGQRVLSQYGIYADSFADCVDEMAPLWIGDGREPFAASYQGLIDEVALYTTTFTIDDVQALYNYQSGYFETTSVQQIGVDAEKPTASLVSTPFFYPQRDRVMAVSARDVPEAYLGIDRAGYPNNMSGIASIEVSVDGGNSWQTAANDTGLYGLGFFTMNPGSDPNYEIQVRATDNVGNVSAVSSTNLDIDNTPPTGAVDSSLFQDVLGLTAGDTLYLYGSLADVDQSGVEAASLELLGTDGLPIAPPQPIFKNAALRHETQVAWGPVAVPFPVLSQGAYLPRLTIEDAVGNVAVITAATTLRVDGLPPLADVTESPQGVLVGRQSLRLHLPFEEGAGATAFADAANLNADLRCSGATCPAAGETGLYGRGLALAFDGTNDYLELAHDEVLNVRDAVTLAAWVRLNDNLPDQKIVGKTNLAGGYLLGVTNGVLYSQVWDNTGQVFSTNWPGVPANTWAHLALTYQTGGDMIGYVNGVEVGRQPASNNPIGSNTFPLRVGVAPWDINAFHTAGLIDEVVIYDSALSPREVQALVAASFVPADTVVQLALDEAAGATSFSDGSANEYDGQCNGGTCPSAGQAGLAGNALSFDGTDDVVSLPNSATWNPSDELTVAAWVNPATVPDGFDVTPLVSKLAEDQGQRTGFVLGLVNGQLSATLSRGFAGEASSASGGTITANTWQHVAMTFAAGEDIILYIDGQEVARASGGFNGSNLSLPIPFNNAAVEIGGTSQSFSGFAPGLNGLLDEVLVFERALTADDIAALTGNLLPLTPDYPAGAVWHRTFDDGGQAGYFGQAKQFGSTAAVETVDFQEFSASSQTFAGWFNLSDVSADQKIIGTGSASGSRFVIGVNQGQLRLEDGFNTFDCGGVPTNQWQHFAVTIDAGKNFICYLNAQATGSGTLSIFAPTSLVGSFTVGAAPWNTSALQVQGLLDDLLVYKRVLGPEDVERLVATGEQRVNKVPLGTPTLRGTITDGPLNGKADFTFHFEEDSGATTFYNAAENRVGLQNDTAARCGGGNCPAAGETGVQGQALSFDGADDYLRFNDAGGAATMSVAAWVYRDGNTNSRQTIVSYKEDQTCGFVLSLNEDGANFYPRIEVNISGGWQFVEQTQSIPLDTWVHLAATFDGDTIRLFRDGQEVAAGNHPGFMTQCAGTSAIGARSSLDQHYFPGRIDEVHIFGRPLSQAGIASLSNTDVVGVEKVLLGFRHPEGAVLRTDRFPPAPSLRLPLDEAQGITTFADVSPQGRDATCQDCPLGGQTGRFDGALYFDGSRHLNLGSSPSRGLTDQSFTAMAWVKLSDLSGDKTIFGNNTLGFLNALHLMVRDGRPHLGFFSQDTTGTTRLEANKWVHLTWRYDHAAQVQSIFVNGDLDAIGTNRLPYQGTGELLLGRAWDGTNFKGWIDEAIIYPRALSDGEIATLARPEGGLPDPVLLLPFEETRYAPAQLTNLFDASGNEAIVACQTGATCPIFNTGGKFGSGVKANPRFENNAEQTSFVIANTPRLDPTAFTLSLWVKTLGNSFTTLLGGFQDDFRLQIVGDNLVLNQPGADNVVFSQAQLPIDDWTHIAMTWEKDGTAVAYINGQEAGRADLSTWATRDNPVYDETFVHLRNGDSIDEMALYDYVLSPGEIQAIADDALWFEANVAQPNAAFSTWQYEVPGGLEGPYRLDLRTSDANGLTRIVPNVWNGEIDTRAPQVTLIAENSGPNLAVSRLTATDLNLRPQSETFTGLNLGAGQLRNIYLDEPWYTQLPDTPLRVTEISNYDAATGQYVPFVTSRPGDDTFTVCDLYDQCTVPVAVTPPPFVPSLPSGLPGNPSLYLGFDETAAAATSFADSSGNFFVGECQTDRCPQTGQAGQKGAAIRLDGQNDYVQVANFLPPTWQSNSGLTAAAWVNLTDGARNQKIISKWSFSKASFILGVVNNRLYIEVVGAPVLVNQGTLIPDNTWTHVAFTATPQGDLIGYVNGQEAARVAFYGGGVIPMAQDDLTVGIFSQNRTEYPVGGLIDEVVVYDRALSPAEMNQLAAITGSRPPAAPQARSRAASPPRISVAAPAALTSTMPVTFAVYAEAMASLQSLTVTIDSAPIFVTSWPSGTLTETLVSTGFWTPTVEGVYTVSAEVRDWTDATAPSLVTPLRVDTAPPTLILSTTRVTAANFDEGYVTLQGVASDTLGLASMQARINGNAWQNISLPSLTNTWQALVNSGSTTPPGNDTLTLTVRAIDQAGWVTTVSNLAAAETTAPNPVTITLLYGGQVISPGGTIYNALTPTVTLAWVSGVDDGDIARYRAGWTQSPQASRGEGLMVYSDTQLSHVQTLTDGGRYYAHVIAEDADGNQTAQSSPLPLYIDFRETPTYVNMDEFGVPYRGWLDNTCSLLGVDNRLDRRSAGSEATGLPQHFYTTWNDSGLRLTWTGADWSTEGDLFIYLDTVAGGSIRAYNPYPATQGNTSIILPTRAVSTTQNRATEPARRTRAAGDPMAADYLVWVQEKTVIMTETRTLSGTLLLTGTVSLSDSLITTVESYTASLLAWDEATTSWQPVGGAWDYGFESVADLPVTDIFLPFERLGITDPANASLSLVALASENNALRLWATMPGRNPVNSGRVIEPEVEGLLQRFVLTERYFWDSLGSNVCPNVVPVATSAPEPAQYTAADVTVKLSADPVGIAYSLLNDDYFFIQDGLSQFANAVDWNSELEALCAANPADPECERPVSSDSDLDFNAADNLNTVVDVEHPPLGDAQVIEYTLRLANEGSGPSTGLVVDMDTWGPLTLPDGEYFSGDFDGEFWEWYNLVFDDLDDLVPGEVITLTFTGVVDVDFDSNNNEGLATLDLTVYDDTGDYFTNNIDWLYLDHPVDDLAPPYLEIQNPVALLGPGQNTFSGFVLDYSPVPTVTLRLTDPTGQMSILTCLDATPDDGRWSCPWDAAGAAEGGRVQVEGRATDIHQQTSDWSSSYNVFYDFIIDATPPAITLSSETQAALADQLLSPDESLLSGTISDNRLVNAVEVCQFEDGTETCQPAELVLAEGTGLRQTYVYTDAPAAPVTIDAGTACEGGTAIVRTFTVTESFTIADVDFGLNVDHAYRHDLSVYLTSPQGTEVTLAFVNSEADNYDVLFNDAVTLIIDDDQISHDTDRPFYENERSAYGYLSNFNREQAQGDWTLRICDFFPAEDDGAYNHSQLVLRSQVTPENTRAAWTYALPLPDDDRSTDYNLRIYGRDSVGNRSTTPISLTYRADTVPPVITVTQQAARLSQTGLPALAGTVADNGGITQLRLTAFTPNQGVLTASLALSGSTWAVYTQTTVFAAAGSYLVWVEAVDAAANETAVGPFTLTSGGYFPLYLPLVVKDTGGTAPRPQPLNSTLPPLSGGDGVEPEPQPLP